MEVPPPDNKFIQNYDSNDGTSGSTANLGEISGVVQNSDTNVGGLTFYNYNDGSTRSAAMTMNVNGRFHFGSGFQDNYKLQVTGSTNITGGLIVGANMTVGGNSYIKEGLILDPMDMGTTTFTNGRNDSASSSVARKNIYKIAPIKDYSSSDWVYLRQIGSGNVGHLA